MTRPGFLIAHMSDLRRGAASFDDTLVRARARTCALLRQAPTVRAFEIL